MIEEFLIKNNNLEEPVPAAIWTNSSDKVIVFVSGSGDVKESFYPIIKSLKNDIGYSPCSLPGWKCEKKY